MYMKNRLNVYKLSLYYNVFVQHHDQQFCDFIHLYIFIAILCWRTIMAKLTFLNEHYSYSNIWLAYLLSQ